MEKENSNSDPNGWAVLDSSWPRLREPGTRTLPPTIVLMISDDQGYGDFGFSGNPAAYTPTIDRLAEEGALFPVAHVGMSRCRASLACLLTGIHPHQHGVYYNFADPQLDPNWDSLPRQLGKAGYENWVGGKYWEALPRHMGFSNVDIDRNRLVRQDQDTVRAFLEATEGNPVFLWWAPMLPHFPHNPAERHLARINEDAIRQPPYIRDEDWENWRNSKKKVLAMGAWLDEGVDELLKLLEEHNRLDNTLIVFLVDNGYEPAFPAKGTVYERGFRTPVILWEPHRIKPETRPDELISTLDILPTILEWAGAETPDTFVGRSMWPLLADPESEWRSALFGAGYPRTASSRDSPSPEEDVQALYMRTIRWKYIVFLRDVESATETGHDYFPGSDPGTKIPAGEEMLFDLSVDPEELNNLADQAAYAADLQTYRAQVFEWWRSTGGGPLPIGPEDLEDSLQSAGLL